MSCCFSCSWGIWASALSFICYEWDQPKANSTVTIATMTLNTTHLNPYTPTKQKPTQKRNYLCIFGSIILATIAQGHLKLLSERMTTNFWNFFRHLHSRETELQYINELRIPFSVTCSLVKHYLWRSDSTTEKKNIKKKEIVILYYLHNIHSQLRVTKSELCDLNFYISQFWEISQNCVIWTCNCVEK